MRVNYYQTVHKALRRLLYLYCIDLGCADMSNKENIQKLQTQFLLLKMKLMAHAHHEDTYLNPFISQKLPEESKNIERDHSRQDKQIDEIDDMFIQMLALKDNFERQNRGYHLYLMFNRFTSEYIAHLDQEEAVLMPLLWERCQDEELMKPLREFIASMSKQDFKDSLEYFLPAINPQEREQMLSFA